MGENIKFLSYNLITGSSTLAPTSGTATKANMLDRDAATQWVSVGEGTDGGTAGVTWTPAASTNIDRFFLKNHNLKKYKLYYNGGTANTFSPDVNETVNTGTNSYYEFTAQAVTSVTLEMEDTIVADEEKSIGALYFGTQKFEVENNPEDYSPILKKKGYDLEMADGGSKSIWVGQKFKATLGFELVSTTEIANFKTLYDDHRNFYFMPTPVTTGTGWDGDAWLCNWVGDYDALKLTNGISKTVGFDINMSLWEASG